VPDFEGLAENGQWSVLHELAVSKLRYNHVQHSKNTLRKEVNGQADGLTYEKAWDILTKHQRKKYPSTESITA
jgi:hypothetical protein